MLPALIGWREETEGAQREDETRADSAAATGRSRGGAEMRGSDMLRPALSLRFGKWGARAVLELREKARVLLLQLLAAGCAEEHLECRS